MELIVDCSPLSEPIFVDRDMYEKVVFNLSQRPKFTLEGQIGSPSGSRGRRRISACGIPARGSGVGARARALPPRPGVQARAERVPALTGARARARGCTSEA
jgi:hypothetical protein